MLPIVTYADMEAFLRPRYKHERLFGRGEDYALAVIEGRISWLLANGDDLISHHESVTGEVVRYTLAEVMGYAKAGGTR